MAAKSDAKILREAVRKLSRACSRKTLFRIPGEGDRGDWRTIKAPYSARVAAFLRDKYPTVIIANEDVSGQAAAWTLIYYDPTEVSVN